VNYVKLRFDAHLCVILVPMMAPCAQYINIVCILTSALEINMRLSAYSIRPFGLCVVAVLYICVLCTDRIGLGLPHDQILSVIRISKTYKRKCFLCLNFERLAIVLFENL
jgi:hypothetical protein